MTAAPGEAPPVSLRARLLGCEVRRLRTGRRLTLIDLAAATGLSPSYLSEVERGKKTPSLAALDRLAGAFGLEREALLPPSSARLDAHGLPFRLRAARLTRGLTQEQLAEAAGVSASLIAQVESGVTQPSLSTLERVAIALGVSPCHLLVDNPDLAETIAGLDADVRAAICEPALQELLRAALRLGQPGRNELLRYASQLAASVESPREPAGSEERGTKS